MGEKREPSCIADGGKNDTATMEKDTDSLKKN